MDPDVTLDQALERARDGRVELGGYTREQLWAYGVPLPSAGVSPQAPDTSRVPPGPRLFRLAMRPPRAVFSAATADTGAEWERVNRFGELVSPEVARVRETGDRNQNFQLSLQPLALLVRQALADAGLAADGPAGMTGAPGTRSRLFAAFPFRMVPVTGRGLRRSERLTQQPFPEGERVWLQVSIDRAPDGAVTCVEERSGRVADYARLAADPTAADVEAHLLGFYGAYWHLAVPAS